MRDVLDEQIAAFQEMLPDLRAQYGRSWIILFEKRVAGAFDTFDKAALYVEEHLKNNDVLIRHTYREQETVPFIFLEETPLSVGI